MIKKTVLLVISAVLCTVALTYTLRANNMPEVKFDLGKNIRETAQKSGAPKFSTRNVAGLISYELVNLPPDIPVNYIRPSYELASLPLFAFTLYADEEHQNNLAVETAALQFSTASIKSHESAKKFVEELISQFHKGKWRRHIDELCPAVTGRSSFLNEAGEVEQIEACPLDPRHRLSAEDWIRLMRMTQNYEWIGDGVLATLTVGYSEDTRGITYSVDLEFNDFEIKNRRDKADQARRLAAGDANGRNGAEKEMKKIQALKSRINILEENARVRGDTVISRYRHNL